MSWILISGSTQLHIILNNNNVAFLSALCRLIFNAITIEAQCNIVDLRGPIQNSVVALGCATSDDVGLLCCASVVNRC